MPNLFLGTINSFCTYLLQQKILYSNKLQFKWVPTAIFKVFIVFKHGQKYIHRVGNLLFIHISCVDCS